MPERTPGFSEIVTLAALAWLAAALVAGVVHVSHDVALLLEVGERLLDGARPYVDYVETNPPLAHYLNAAVVAGGRLFGVGPVAALWVVVFAGVCGGCLALRVGGRPVWGERGAARAAAAFAGVALFVAAVGNLGQRDHLFVLLFTPWAVHRLRVEAGHGSAGWGVAAGVLGAVGVCIKPHFLLVAGVFEIWLALRARRRWFEPGLAAFAVTGLCYPLHFLLLPDDVRTAFFEVWLPVIAGGYRAYGDTRLAFTYMAPMWASVAVLAVVAAWPRQRGLGVLALAALAVYVLQWKGWYYHLIPAMSFASAGAAVVIGAHASGARLNAVRFSGAWVVLVAGLMLLEGNAVPDEEEARAAFAQRIQPGQSALVLTTELSPAYPSLMLQGVRRTGTYPVVFPLVVLFPDGHPEPFGAPDTAAEAVFRTDIARDLAAGPDWVLIDAHSPCVNCGPGVDVHRYLRDIGLEDVLESSYEHVTVAAGLEMWRRRGP